MSSVLTKLSLIKSSETAKLLKMNSILWMAIGSSTVCKNGSAHSFVNYNSLQNVFVKCAELTYEASASILSA